jgi:hypothetical protein
MDVVPIPGGVAIYHTTQCDPVKANCVSREVFSVETDRELFARGVNGHIGLLLRREGFVAVGHPNRKQYIFPKPDAAGLRKDSASESEQPINVSAHIRWTWDVEFLSGNVWIAPLIGRQFLTCEGPNELYVSRWLATRLISNPHVVAVDVSTGRRARLALADGNWSHLENHGGGKLRGGNWRVTLDMRALKELGYSTAAYYSSQFTFERLVSEIQSCPAFRELVSTAEPRELRESQSGHLEGQCLLFRRGAGNALKQVLRLGVLEAPPGTVSITVAATNKSSAKTSGLRITLNERLKPSGQISKIWRGTANGLSLDPFKVVPQVIHAYDPETGKLTNPVALHKVAEEALDNGHSLVVLVVVPDRIGDRQFHVLLKEFRHLKALAVRESSLQDVSKYAAWVNLSLALSQKAGARPWLLHNLPGVDEGTVFVGIDLGHNHRTAATNLAVTLIDHQGRPVDAHVVRCPQMDEHLARDTVVAELRRLIQRRRPHPTQVILHRDGRYFERESEDLQDALSEVANVTLVAIKKNSNSRLMDINLDGAFARLSPTRALLITNIQARSISMPVPLEVELIAAGHQTLESVTAQVFWLTRVCRGSAYHPRRLPLTTEWANNIAATGKKIHLLGWHH